ncbi:diguanylate cyclase [Vogesella sp. DC21W]|uniref:diguanylate cyclase n=1 Tax=Vogesella aquatica TaxID=2984206 RepID=A0ABT5IVV4_9NEIS|nr:diguanylate cyclase [Vogesella aquatica]MDC7716708.1 diguanylate cyclase [Vogesella aquatica]
MKPALLQQEFASYEHYYSQRLLPGAALLSYAGMGVIALFLAADLWHFGFGQVFAGMALASVLGCALISWMAHSMQHPAYQAYRIHWVLWLGNLSMVVMMAGNILVLGRLSYLPMIVMYFMLGVLLVAPLVAPLAFLLPHLASVLLAGAVMWLKGYQLTHWLQLLLFSMPAMVFMLMILSVQHRTAMLSYQIARQNWLYATTDPLSQLQNRRTWYEAAAQALAQAATQAQPLALLMLDIDHFKAINDQWGHVAGDKVIEQVGRTLQAHCPPGALAGRLGGEEFAVLLPGTTHDNAVLTAEALRASLAAQLVPEQGQLLHITVSIGLSSLHTASLDELVREADRRLYQAKAEGRNRVVGQ